MSTVDTHIPAADLTPGMVVFTGDGEHGTVRCVEPSSTTQVVILFAGGYTETARRDDKYLLVPVAEQHRTAIIDGLSRLTFALQCHAPLPDTIKVAAEYGSNTDLNALADKLGTPVRRTATGYARTGFVVELDGAVVLDVSAYGVRDTGGDQ